MFIDSLLEKFNDTYSKKVIYGYVTIYCNHLRYDKYSDLVICENVDYFGFTPTCIVAKIPFQECKENCEIIYDYD